MDNIKHTQVYGLIKVMNDVGLQVIYIDREYFAVDNFVPADRNTPYHTLHGRHITKIVNDLTGLGVSDKEALRQKIQQLPERDLKYSPHHMWKWMIN